MLICLCETKLQIRPMYFFVLLCVSEFFRSVSHVFVGFLEFSVGLTRFWLLLPFFSFHYNFTSCLNCCKRSFVCPYGFLICSLFFCLVSCKLD